MQHEPCNVFISSSRKSINELGHYLAAISAVMGHYHTVPGHCQEACADFMNTHRYTQLTGVGRGK